MKRAILMLAAVPLLLVPGSSRAAAATFAPPWTLGPQGGDSANHWDVHADTGQMTGLRVQPAGISGGLGCGGSGGFSYFEKTFTGAGISGVTVSYSDALVDPYTFLQLAVRQNDQFIAGGNKEVHGLIAGDGTLSLAFPPTDGTITVWFGIKITSACPNIDGGTATFDGLTITSG